jgi:hypothetical protein
VNAFAISRTPLFLNSLFNLEDLDSSK